jgi:hypothetical protein
MDNWCICWFFTHVFKGLTARRLYKSFGVKGLIVLVSTAAAYSQKVMPPAVHDVWVHTRAYGNHIV